MSKSLLLQIVRDSITEVFEAKKIIDKEQLLRDYPVLNEQIASFVNIYLNSELRGSRGSFFPNRSLLEDLIFNAKAAAFENTDFPPLKTSEYLHATIELSLLTPPQELTYSCIDEIKAQVIPNKHGLSIALNDKRASLLPNQWLRYHDFESFFSHLLSQAELSLSDMQAHPTISIFDVEKQIDEPILP